MSREEQIKRLQKLVEIDADPKKALVDLMDKTDEELAKLSEEMEGVREFVEDAVAMKIDGEDGEIGPQGPQGEPGEKGEKGDVGPAGPQGPKGDKGEDGRDGRDGVDGQDGNDGEDGEIGPIPKHEWESTKLRFEEEPGKWGEFVDLRGPRGHEGDRHHVGVRNASGFVTTSAQTLDFSTGTQVSQSGADTVITVTGAGVDHGLLSGLSDDDHPQYMQKPADVAAEIYVNVTTGDDTNDGLAVGTPVKTFNKAVSIAAGLRNNAGININFADGTYPVVNEAIPDALYGEVTFIGNTTTPTNVIFDAQGVFSNWCIFHEDSKATLTFSGISFQNSLITFQIDNTSVRFGYCDFTNVVFSLFAFNNANINWIANGNGDTTFNFDASGGGNFFNGYCSVLVDQSLTMTNAGQGFRLTDTSTLRLAAGFTQTINLIASSTEGFGAYSGSFISVFSNLTVTGANTSGVKSALWISDSQLSILQNAVFSFNTLAVGIRANLASSLSTSTIVATYTNVTIPVQIGPNVVFQSIDDFDTQIDFSSRLDERSGYEVHTFYERMIYN